MVKRYEFTCHDSDPDAVNVNHGRYVCYSDYAELEAENERLKQEVADANADRDRWYGSSFEATKRAEAAERLAGERVVTDAMIEAGLEYYAEGGCGGLADHERREVVEAIIEAALAGAKP